jgi:predicted RNA-binding Zn-ribbon protein involved in translation (DUF1610 family)
MIKFTCSKCSRHITVDEKHAGKKGKCPDCGQVVVVPGESKTFAFSCPSCKYKIKVAESYAGRKAKCPKCKESVEVPFGNEIPVPEARSATVACGICGQAVRVPEGTVGESLQCPKCGSYVDPASGGFASEVAEPATNGEEEEYYEESYGASTPTESMGRDRRLILILSGMALIVVVGIIALIVFLKSSGSSPAQQLDTPLQPGQVADVNSQPQPPKSVAQRTEEAVTPEIASTAPLQFGPAPGTKRTMRISTATTQSIQIAEQEPDITAVETFTFDLEAMPAGTDGTIPLRVSLEAVQIETGTADAMVGKYDSTKPQNGTKNTIGEWYGLFLGKPFTISVSSRGEIASLALDELFVAAAEERLRAEGRTDLRSDSHQESVLRMKTHLEGFPVMSRDKVSNLISELIFMLPDEPLRTDTTWNRSMSIPQVNRRLALATAYTVTSVEDGICTIQAEGKRSYEEEAVVQEMGQAKLSYKLGGTCHTTFTLDSRMGWLLGKEQQTNLSGQMVMTGTGSPELDRANQVALEIAVTVTTVE